MTAAIWGVGRVVPLARAGGRRAVASAVASAAWRPSSHVECVPTFPRRESVVCQACLMRVPAQFGRAVACLAVSAWLRLEPAAVRAAAGVLGARRRRRRRCGDRRPRRRAGARPAVGGRRTARDRRPGRRRDVRAHRRRAAAHAVSNARRVAAAESGGDTTGGCSVATWTRDADRSGAAWPRPALTARAAQPRAQRDDTAAAGRQQRSAERGHALLDRQAGDVRADRHPAGYSSCSRYQRSLSLRPSGARSNHWNMPHSASPPRA